jgi:hypothetical protein
MDDPGKSLGRDFPDISRRSQPQKLGDFADKHVGVTFPRKDLPSFDGPGDLLESRHVPALGLIGIIIASLLAQPPL